MSAVLVGLVVVNIERRIFSLSCDDVRTKAGRELGNTHQDPSLMASRYVYRLSHRFTRSAAHMLWRKG